MFSAGPCVVVVQLLSCVQLSATPWTATCQASLSITNPQNLLKLRSIKSVMPSNHLILCHLLLPSIFSSIRIFSNESALHIRWPKCWSFSFSTSPSNEYSGLISFRIDCYISLLPTQLSRVFSSTRAGGFFTAETPGKPYRPLGLYLQCLHICIYSSVLP